MCWFSIFIRMWVFLSTSHATITAKENLANKSYFYLGLLSNLVDLLRQCDARSIILDIFDPSPPRETALLEV